MERGRGMVLRNAKIDRMWTRHCGFVMTHDQRVAGLRQKCWYTSGLYRVVIVRLDRTIQFLMSGFPDRVGE